MWRTACAACTPIIWMCCTPTGRPPISALEETVEAMMKLKEQGKIRAIGASNVTADIIRGYCKYGQLDVIQEKYSLLTRRVEKQLLPTCKELGVSVQAYSPLEQGLLTGKVTMDTTYPEGSTRNSNPSFQPARRAQALDMLAKWGDLTEKYDCSLAQLVIALTARMIPGLHVLCGARTPQQVRDNAGALADDAGFLYDSFCENAMPDSPQAVRHCSYKNKNSAVYGQSKAEAI